MFVQVCGCCDADVLYDSARYANKKLFDEEAILKDLSPSLRRAIALHNARNLISIVPLFHDARMVRDVGSTCVCLCGRRYQLLCIPIIPLLLVPLLPPSSVSMQSLNVEPRASLTR